MSAATVARVPYFTVPNSFIENSALLTDAEIRLALVMLRRPNQTISDHNWGAWTGLSARLKEYAIRGLKEKGVIDMRGRGERALYQFQPDEWIKYARHADRTIRPKTAGARKSVEPKAGARIHPECRERGCQLLRQTTGETGLSGLDATQIAQPVAQTENLDSIGRRCSGAVTDSAAAAAETRPEQLITLIAPLIAQPVARSAEAIEKTWEKTLAAIHQCGFAWVWVAFLLKLVAAVRALWPQATDDQVAAAVAIAFAAKRGRQYSEALFLCTVPEAMHVVMKRPKAAGDRAAPPGAADDMRAALKRAASEYRARGAPCEAWAPKCDELVERLNALAPDDVANLEKVYLAMEGIREGVAKSCAARSLSLDERREIQTTYEPQLKSYAARMNDAQLETLRNKLFLRGVESRLQLPELR
jgi:hypothetical protein